MGADGRPDVLVDHDLHVHTFLSACSSDEQATPERMIARAAEAGLRTLGFADHMWDSRVPGASDWYRPQTFEHISRVREQMSDDTGGVRVLFGCETEYCGGGKVGISREVAEQLDFVLVPASHFHMKGFVEPPGIDGPGDVAALMVERFNEVVELGLATGVAHPFETCGYGDRTDEILARISDGQLLDCFGRAAERGVSIEITTNFFPLLAAGGASGPHDASYLRVLSLAKRAGCLFHFASDAHQLARIGEVLSLDPLARTLGITRDDLHPLVR